MATGQVLSAVMSWAWLPGVFGAFGTQQIGMCYTQEYTADSQEAVGGVLTVSAALFFSMLMHMIGTCLEVRGQLVEVWF